MAKLEKADILELTVRHLQTLRHQNQLGTRGDQSYAERFKAGFRHCAAEVTHFLGVMDQDTSIHVLKHLNGCINRLETATGQPAQSANPAQAAELAAATPAAAPHATRSVPPVPATVWMQKNNQMGPPAAAGQPTNHQAMQYRQREHQHPVMAAAVAAAAFYANRQQLRQSPTANMHMESSIRINTPPMSPNIEVDDMPVWRPW